MDIKSIRHATELSQREFAEEFGIPLGTLRNWEQGLSNPPSYVFTMIAAQTRRNYMINVETLYFLKQVEDLAEMSKNGIMPFAEATQETFRKAIFFDEKEEIAPGKYPIVLDVCLIDDPDCYHHDVISHYENDGYRMYAKRHLEEDGGEWHVCVDFVDIEGIQLIIEDGNWYFV